MDIVNRIALIPLFKGLSKDQYDDLAKITLLRSFSKGQTIFSEGGRGNRLLRNPADRIESLKKLPHSGYYP